MSKMENYTKNSADIPHNRTNFEKLFLNFLSTFEKANLRVL